MRELVRRRLVAEIERALNELPEEQRAVFVAHELEGRSFKSMAAATGVNVNTLLARKRYAVRHLRKRLQLAFDEMRDTTGRVNHGAQGSKVAPRQIAENIAHGIGQGRLPLASPCAIGVRRSSSCSAGSWCRWLWNWLLPDIFGLRQITFWQALGLLALCRILFGSFGRGGGPHRDTGRAPIVSGGRSVPEQAGPATSHEPRA